MCSHSLCSVLYALLFYAPQNVNPNAKVMQHKMYRKCSVQQGSVHWIQKQLTGPLGLSMRILLTMTDGSCNEAENAVSVLYAAGELEQSVSGKCRFS